MCFDMKLRLAVCVGLLFPVFCFTRTYGQQSSDSVLYEESISKIHQVYLKEIGDNAQIYHGTEFIRNGQKANGFPFYQSDNMIAGSVYYQGMTYPNQNIYYNIVSDELITNNYTKNAFIVLAPEKVDYFFLYSEPCFCTPDSQQI